MFCYKKYTESFHYSRSLGNRNSYIFKFLDVLGFGQIETIFKARSVGNVAHLSDSRWEVENRPRGD